jgi:hypothetical protein
MRSEIGKHVIVISNDGATEPVNLEDQLPLSEGYKSHFAMRGRK